MTPDDFNDKEVGLLAKSLSIHRQAMRRKLERLDDTEASERAVTLDELELTQALLERFNKADFDRLSA